MTAPECLAGPRRRRAAAQWMKPLHCGCRDPWTCRHHDDDQPITEQWVNGYRDAAEHLLAEGYPPAPNIPAMRVMWQRRGDDQRLAVRISELWEVAS